MWMLDCFILVPVIRPAAFRVALPAVSMRSALLILIRPKVSPYQGMAESTLSFVGVGLPALVSLALSTADLALSALRSVFWGEIVPPAAHLVHKDLSGIALSSG